MEHIDYKFLFKVFTVLFKNRKTINLKPIGKALRWFFNQPEVEKCIPYAGALYKYILTPTVFFAYIATGYCDASLYLFRTGSVPGAIGIQLTFVVIALINAWIMIKATSKIKVKIMITGTL